MDAKSLIGRDKELKILQKIYESYQPELLAVYGRRRIGKTFLITEFFKDKGVYFEITGMKGGTTSEQLFQFAYEFSRQFNKGEKIKTPASWIEAFQLLNETIERVNKEKKIILFFDEVPWLASPKSKFLNALEHFWNRYLSKRTNVILIICGSAASWVIKNIINNKGGLHGRITQKMQLLPFTVEVVEDYLKSRSIELDRKQIVDLYMAIGGVPKYLSYIEKGKSVAQNINDICFVPRGGLYDEFDNLYRSLFDKYEHHVAIVKALASKKEGLEKGELLLKAHLSSGGTSSNIIQDLINSGFIIYVPPFGKKKMKGIYRLVDEYSLFYLTWMADLTKTSIKDEETLFWVKTYGSSKWNAWSGIAFEALCIKHIHKIKKALGISGVNTVESGWRYTTKKASLERGAQIDLIIDRADRCINLCEMKYRDSEFVVDKAYAEKLENKKSIFREQTKTNKALFTTLITTYGAKKNMHYLSTVDNQLTIEVFFEN